MTGDFVRISSLQIGSGGTLNIRDHQAHLTCCLLQEERALVAPHIVDHIGDEVAGDGDDEVTL